ncbi:MAG: transposase, partial [Candidatus Pacebacteria bacterium]|nr:transposase [Candidatus Paceibacterota bacterium]
MRYSARQKLRILKNILKSPKSVSEACREVGISRKTFYQWKKIYQSAPARIKRKSLALKYTFGSKHPRAKRAYFKNHLLALIVCQPEWGGRKISQALKDGGANLSPHGVFELLKELNLNTREKRQAYASLYQTFGKIKNLYQKKPLRFLPEERKKLVEAVLINKEKVSDVCLKAHLSRKTFYKWKNRYLEASQQAVSLLEAMSDRYPEGEKHPRIVPDKTEKQILKIVVRHPAYSTHKVAGLLKGIGNHGVQNVFKRLGLNTYQLRLAYSHSCRFVPKPVFGFPAKVKKLFGFIPSISAIPPPGDWRISSFWRNRKQNFRPFYLSFISSLILSNFLAFLFKIIFQAEDFSAKIGLVFATASLATGSFFFAYSMKYY